MAQTAAAVATKPKAHSVEPIMTKAEARRAFGWVPKNQRNQPEMITRLKTQGIVTKDQFKAYMRTTGMPDIEMGGLKALQQSQRQKQGQRIAQAQGQKKTISGTKQAVSKQRGLDAIKTAKRAQFEPQNGQKRHSVELQGQSQAMSMKMSMSMSH